MFPILNWIPREVDPAQNSPEGWKRKSRRRNRRIRKQK